VIGPPERLVLEALAGAGIGLLAALLHLASLRWALRRLDRARRPGAFLAASSLVRVLLVAALLVVATGGRPAALAGALVGLVATRLLVVRRVLTAPRGSDGGQRIRTTT
jgi:F1F0 ATPase subunit 2